MAHWFEEWHGAKLPSTVVSGLSGGSTAMSTGVANALSTKASLGHTHPVATASTTGFVPVLSGLATEFLNGSGAFSVPTGLGGSTLLADLTGVQNALSTKASLGHTHPQADVTDLTSTLAALSAQISTKAAGSHTHAQADVTDLTSTLAALSAQISTKAAGTHTHAQADVTDLTSTLAALSAQISTKAAGAHVHAVVSSVADGFAPQRPANSTTFLRSDGAWASPPSGVGGGPSMVKTTAPTVTASSFADITGLSFSVSSASAYYFEFFLNWNVAVTTNGAKFSISGPSAPTRVNYQIDISTGLSGSLVRSAQAYDTCVAITAAASTGTWPAWIGGVLITGGNAGTLIARAAPRVTTTNVTVSSGSIGLLYGPV